MINLYIDESGTMKSGNNEKVIISIVNIIDNKKVKIRLKRFIQKHFKELKLNDRNGKMFNNEKFLELKGSCLTPQLKKELVTYLSTLKTFELYIIEMNNDTVDPKLYNDKARAFNYILKLSLEFFINHNFFKKNEQYHITIDERNVKVNAKRSLEDYINTTLQLEEKLTDEIKVEYHDSIQYFNIQLADFFANLYYSNCKTHNYTDQLKMLKENNILVKVFKFPPCN